MSEQESQDQTEGRTEDQTEDQTEDTTEDQGQSRTQAQSQGDTETTGVPDEALPEELVPSEDNPLAEGLPPGETAEGLLDEDQDQHKSSPGEE